MMDLRLGDSVGQAQGDRQESSEEPQPPPQRARGALHHLVATETAVPVERPCDAPASRALVELQPAVGAARFLGVVEHHRRLVAPRAQAGRDEGQRRELHISVTTGITIGLRRVRL